MENKMSASVKKLPLFKMSMFDLVQNKEHGYKGEEIMDVVIYLPGMSVPCNDTPRVMSYREGSGRETAIMFTGAQIALDDRNLRRLCKRLMVARRSFVSYVRMLAAHA